MTSQSEGGGTSSRSIRLISSLLALCSVVFFWSALEGGTRGDTAVTHMARLGLFPGSFSRWHLGAEGDCVAPCQSWRSGIFMMTPRVRVAVPKPKAEIQYSTLVLLPERLTRHYCV